MPKYKKRADGRYCTNITVGFDQSTGKRKYKTIYGRTIQELEVKLADFRALQSKGVVISDEHMTLGDWADKWLVAYKSGLAYSTVKMYENCVKAHIQPSRVARLPLNKIKTIDLRKAINAELDAGKARTAQILLMTLKQIFNQALENQLIYSNPAKTIKLPLPKPAKKRALTDIEKAALASAVLSDRETAFVMCGRYAGLRRGEILALMKNDLDLNLGVIKVDRTIVFDGNSPIVEPFLKTAAGTREVPMPRVMIDFMRRYLDTLDGLYLFTMRGGALMSKTSFRRMWESIISKLNAAAGGTQDLSVIIGLTPHILRHDYATSLISACVDIKDLKTAQRILGHSDMRVTLEIYTHLKQDNAIVNKLDAFWASEALDIRRDF